MCSKLEAESRREPGLPTPPTLYVLEGRHHQRFLGVQASPHSSSHLTESSPVP